MSVNNVLSYNMTKLFEQRIAEKNLEIPVIRFTDEAYDKVRALIKICDKEIAWHGLVRVEGNVYTIYDVLLYPQRITGTTVEAIEDEYGLWVTELEDEQFENMRMQGHSHVSMGVSPSGTDESYYDELISHVEDFYIVMIMNKRDEHLFRFYDIRNNVIFDKLPIEVGSHTLQEWALNGMSQYVMENAPITPVYQKPNNYGYDYNHGQYNHRNYMDQVNQFDKMTDDEFENFYDLDQLDIQTFFDNDKHNPLISKMIIRETQQIGFSVANDADFNNKKAKLTNLLYNLKPYFAGQNLIEVTVLQGDDYMGSVYTVAQRLSDVISVAYKEILMNDFGNEKEAEEQAEIMRIETLHLDWNKTQLMDTPEGFSFFIKGGQVNELK